MKKAERMTDTKFKVGQTVYWEDWDDGVLYVAKGKVKKAYPEYLGCSSHYVVIQRIRGVTHEYSFSEHELFDDELVACKGVHDALEDLTDRCKKELNRVSRRIKKLKKEEEYAKDCGEDK